MSGGHSTSTIRRPRARRGGRSGSDGRDVGNGGNGGNGGDGRSVRSIRNGPSGRTDRGASAATRSTRPRRTDLTQPIAFERQLVTRRANRWVLALLALGVLAALAAALFVLPVQAWLRQEDDLAAKRAELEVLEDANTELQLENDRLQTPAGAQEAARDELGVVEEGEHRVSVLPSGSAPLTLPSGWPFDTVTQIVAARAAIVTAASAPPTTTPPSPAPTAAPPTAPPTIGPTTTPSAAPAPTP